MNGSMQTSGVIIVTFYLQSAIISSVPIHLVQLLRGVYKALFFKRVSSFVGQQVMLLKIFTRRFVGQVLLAGGAMFLIVLVPHFLEQNADDDVGAVSDDQKVNKKE